MLGINYNCDIISASSYCMSSNFGNELLNFISTIDKEWEFEESLTLYILKPCLASSSKKKNSLFYSEADSDRKIFLVYFAGALIGKLEILMILEFFIDFTESIWL